MKDFFSQLFSENGRVSMMRVMSIISLLAGVGVAFVGLDKTPVDYSGISLVVSVFLGAAFGGKVMQKRVEATNAKADIEVDMAPKVEPKKKCEPCDCKSAPKVDNPD
jgi:hypothetical protein